MNIDKAIPAYNLTLDEYAARVLIKAEHPPAVCSYCGFSLPENYYLVLTAWQSKTAEFVSPQCRLCQACFNILTKYLRGETKD